MKERVYKIGFLFVAILCAAVTLTQVPVSGTVLSLLAVPFEQMGYLLRKISLLGQVGNGLAWVFYVLICLLPVGVLVLLCRKREFANEDFLLIIMSLLLFVVMYEMINPNSLSGFAKFAAFSDYKIQQIILGGTMYSILIGYLVLRIVHIFCERENVQLYLYLRILLTILGFLFVISAFGTSLGELITKFISVKAGNTDPNVHLGFTYGFLLLHYLIDILPFVLNLQTILLTLRLVEEMRTERYSETVVEVAERLTLWCKKTLCFVMLSNIFVNILQVFCMDELMDVQTEVLVPITSVLFVLVVLLVSKMITENHKLKDDNDLFI